MQVIPGLRLPPEPLHPDLLQARAEMVEHRIPKADYQAGRRQRQSALQEKPPFRLTIVMRVEMPGEEEGTYERLAYGRRIDGARLRLRHHGVPATTGARHVLPRYPLQRQHIAATSYLGPVQGGGRAELAEWRSKLLHELWGAVMSPSAESRPEADGRTRLMRNHPFPRGTGASIGKGTATT